MGEIDDLEEYFIRRGISADEIIKHRKLSVFGGVSNA